MTSSKFQIGDRIHLRNFPQLIGTIIEITKEERYSVEWDDGIKDADWTGSQSHLFQDAIDKLKDVL